MIFGEIFFRIFSYFSLQQKSLYLMERSVPPTSAIKEGLTLRESVDQSTKGKRCEVLLEVVP